MTSGSPLRRVAVIVLLYVAAGWVVLSLGGWLRRVLVLPPLFDTLLRAGLAVGLLVAVALAWSYPRLAGGSESETPGPRVSRGRGDR